ncbi:DUF6053 domain-containing protein [Lysobacter enzymogenes]|uniref:DUF6053 domain-containing protein n=1 Tax=Lysobacter enzymogenes TaxID=69 RepID=UPI00374A300B
MRPVRLGRAGQAGRGARGGGDVAVLARTAVSAAPRAAVGGASAPMPFAQVVAIRGKSIGAEALPTTAKRKKSAASAPGGRGALVRTALTSPLRASRTCRRSCR